MSKHVDAGKRVTALLGAGATLDIGGVDARLYF